MTIRLTIRLTLKTGALLLALGVYALSVRAGAAPDVALPDGSFLARMAQEHSAAAQKAARLAQVRRYAAAIKRGTPRSLVVRLFPKADGGLTSSGLARYSAGDGILVDVPYDDHGGYFNAQNRVSGPLRVYRGSFHTD